MATNYDLIRNMNVCEMAEFLGKMSETIDCNSCPVTNLCQHGIDCVETYKKWLESEVE